MLTLDRIRDEILALIKACESNPERAQSGIQEIFYMLMCADQPFYLIYNVDIPLLSPAVSDAKNLYLRLFSHREIAEKYSARTKTVYKEHTLLDMLQIGRWAFLGGAYGIILNEGDRWMLITIPEFISLFFARIYGDDSLCEPSCVEAVSFINEVRRNGAYRYGMKLNENGDWTGEVQPGLLPPLTIRALFHVPTDNLKVEKDGVPYIFSRDILQKALALCGNMSDTTGKTSGNTHENEPISLQSFADGSWRVSEPENLALTFDSFFSKEHIEKPLSDDEQKTEPYPVATAVSDPTNKMENFLSSLLRKFRRKPAGVEAVQKSAASVLEPKSPEPESIVEPIREPEQSPKDEPECDATAEVTPQQDPFDNENESMAGETSTEGEKNGKKGQKKIWFALAVVLAIALIVGGLFSASHLRYKENLKTFRAYIAAQDYANAYVLYQDAKFGSDADGYMMDEVDGIVLRYANNEISAEELNAALKALSNFSSLSQELEIAKLTASKLEESKNAYVSGRESTDIYERLNAWRQVVQLDAVNYAAVRQSVEDNESRYVDILRADIEYYRTRVLEFAADRVDILSYWYPENEHVPALVKEFSSVRSVPLSYYPVAISDIWVRQEANSYWTLYVRWSNLSVKTIKSICFSVVALGENGRIVTCRDVQGEWKIFDAVDEHQYEPGVEPSFDSYYWDGAFYGPDVRSVRLTAVNIGYRDGSSASYTSDIDLDNIRTT